MPLAIILIEVGLENAKEDRIRFRRYDPQEWTDDQLQQSVRIVVPAFVNDAGGEYPVTIVNT